jgi:predicted NAD/FAD-dependent oxidoreductase
LFISDDGVFMKKKIAIIGAGISGLVLAQNLKNDADVTVFEKARGVGGRMSTRYADPFYFDHGTQFFTARTKPFQEFLKAFTDQGIITEWSGKIINLEIGKKETKRMWFEPHFVATPNMNSLCKKLAEGLDIKLSVEIAPIDQKDTDKWILRDKEQNNLGNYDLVISTAPPAQTLKLLKKALPNDTLFDQTSMQGCYALMLGFNKPWDKKWIAAKVQNNPIKWIAINSSKPGRNKTVTSIVAHSCNDWAEQHMDDNLEEAQTFLVNQFEDVTGISTSNADYISVHRWKYAIVEHTHNSGFYFDQYTGIAATSDWASASRIEEVWLDAKKLAEKIISMPSA